MAFGLALLLAASRAQAGELLLGQERVELWSGVTMAGEGSQRLELSDARALPFAPPTGARAALGLNKQAVWLRTQVRVPPHDDGHWVLDIDYPVLNQVDVHLLRDGELVQRAALGNLLPFAQRPLASRSLALPLFLEPGAAYELVLRVQSQGALTVPITLAKPTAFQARALTEQMLQGLLNGLGIALLIYSLVQGLAQREPLFAKYALLISGSLLFTLLQSGTGAQFLWTDNFWMERHAGGLAALMAACGSFLFIEQAVTDASRAWRLMMRGGAALTLLVGVSYALDLIDVHLVTAVIGSLGLAPALMGMPGMWRAVRRGEAIGWTLLLAWAAYFLCTAVAVGVIKGSIDANFWTLHTFQFGATFDMLMFMRVLGLRSAAIRAAALQSRHERDLLHMLAHTDPLTGLANRRGLEAVTASALARRQPSQVLALFVLDLNGFKLVNDQHGHQVGDALLVAVGQRLRAALPATDQVARLGGDEFVVVCPALSDGAQADALAERLFDVFAAPFGVGELTLRLGVSTGRALAPQDGASLERLLTQADAAMYRRKPGRAPQAELGPA